MVGRKKKREIKVKENEKKNKIKKDLKLINQIEGSARYICLSIHLWVTKFNRGPNFFL